jgi:hypothetical protein
MLHVQTGGYSEDMIPTVMPQFIESTTLLNK